jgi:hypothetical protein
MKRVGLLSLLALLAVVPVQAQTGPCTESAIKQNTMTPADDMFSYMPPYGRPVVGKAATQKANAASFSARTNITRSWAGDHRIVSSPSGDMAYEYGTQRTTFDEGGKRTEFEAAMLIVYRATGSVCQIAALTMHPLDEPKK